MGLKVHQSHLQGPLVLMLNLDFKIMKRTIFLLITLLTVSCSDFEEQPKIRMNPQVLEQMFCLPMPFATVFKLHQTKLF